MSRLWTPIANAWEVYRRRLIVDNDAHYELVWRLIHVHESLVVSLGALLATRLLERWPQGVDERAALIRHIGGLAFVDGQLERKPENSCLSGYVKPWLDLLQRFGPLATLEDCSFCKEVGAYLAFDFDTSDEDGKGPKGKVTAKARANDLDRLRRLRASVWQPLRQIGSRSESESNTSRFGRLLAVHELRNKMAHLPLHFSLVEEVHRCLRQDILALLSPSYKAEKDDISRDFTGHDWFECLCGVLRRNKGETSGSVFSQATDSRFEDGCTALATTDGDPQWRVGPFIRLDSELKASLLFEVAGLEKLSDPEYGGFLATYHRFAAESEPERRLALQKEDLAFLVPQISSAAAVIEQVVSESPPAESPQAEPEKRPEPGTREAALDLMNRQDFFEADKAFEELRKAAPINHVLLLLQGKANWRLAQDSQDESELLFRLERADKLLTEASKHRDPRYRAEALYLKSKVQWLHWRRLGDVDALDEAKTSAANALVTLYLIKYLNWYEKVMADLMAANKEVGSEEAAEANEVRIDSKTESSE